MAKSAKAFRYLGVVITVGLLAIGIVLIVQVITVFS